MADEKDPLTQEDTVNTRGMGMMPVKELMSMFKQEVTQRAKKIDPDDEEDWKSLTLGWALAKGMEPDDALRFKLFISYETDLV